MADREEPSTEGCWRVSWFEPAPTMLRPSGHFPDSGIRRATCSTFAATQSHFGEGIFYRSSRPNGTRPPLRVADSHHLAAQSQGQQRLQAVRETMGTLGRLCTLEPGSDGLLLSAVTFVSSGTCSDVWGRNRGKREKKRKQGTCVHSVQACK